MSRNRAGMVLLCLIRTGLVRMGRGALAFPVGRPESRPVEGARNEGARGRDAGPGLRLVLAGAIAAGAAARLLLAALRPLWADEVFTLSVARLPLPDLLAALRLDSGPPLHYLAAKVLLLPFAAPGPADVLVRLLSVAASLLHAPLLVRIGRRCDAPRAGAVAAALFLLFPLAAASGAEGRGYALASLLALAAFERLLALRDSPRARTAVAAGLLGGAAVLTHYLALLPVGGALVASLARGPRRRFPLLAGAVAAALAGAWLPVALGQPRASMAWTEAQPLGERALQAAANLGLGLPVDAGTARFAGPLALALLAVALLSRRAVARVPAAVPLGAALALLGPLALFSTAALLPDRTAVLLLPLVALVLAEAHGVLAAVAGLAVALVLAGSLPGWLRTTPAAQLAGTLERPVREGGRVVAAGLWGPELDYRLARAGLPGRVSLFPSEVARHPGWYDDSAAPRARLASEAASAVRGAAGRTFFVVPPGTGAGRALASALEGAGATRVAAAGVFDVWLLDGRAVPGAFPAPAAPRPGGRT